MPVTDSAAGKVCLYAADSHAFHTSRCHGKFREKLRAFSKKGSVVAVSLRTALNEPCRDELRSLYCIRFGAASDDLEKLLQQPVREALESPLALRLSCCREPATPRYGSQWLSSQLFAFGEAGF